MSEYPIAFDIVLEEIGKVLPEPCIAGGAIRDCENDRPIKDIDVFVKLKRYSAMHGKIAGGLHKLFDVPESACMPKNMSDYINKEIMHMYDIKLPDIDYKIQLMVFSDEYKSDFMTSFDLGICQIQYDGAVVKRHKNYIKDMENKTITVTNCRSRSALARTRNHLYRVWAKYPEHVVDLKSADKFGVMINAEHRDKVLAAIEEVKKARAAKIVWQYAQPARRFPMRIENV